MSLVSVMQRLKRASLAPLRSGRISSGSCSSGGGRLSSLGPSFGSKNDTALIVCAKSLSTSLRSFQITPEAVAPSISATEAVSPNGRLRPKKNFFGVRFSSPVLAS